jgi:hypothetical protein
MAAKQRVKFRLRASADTTSVRTSDGMGEGTFGEGDEQEQQTTLEVFMDPHQAAGVWANFARVNHSEHEFTIDFVRIDYANAPKLTGIVVARVGVSPLFVTQLIGALQENWNMYARKAMPKEVYGDDAADEGDA